MNTQIAAPAYSDATARAFLARVRAGLSIAERWELDTRYRTSWNHVDHRHISELQLLAKDAVRYLARLETDGCGISEEQVKAFYARLGAPAAAYV
jgi:hypothetical protein